MSQRRRICPTCEGSGFIMPAPPETEKRDRHDFFDHLEQKKEKVRNTYRFEKGDDVERRIHLPSDHPDHLCGLLCDGLDGLKVSECSKTRTRLFGKHHISDRERQTFRRDDPRLNVTCFTCGKPVNDGRHLKDQPCPESEVR